MQTALKESTLSDAWDETRAMRRLAMKCLTEAAKKRRWKKYVLDLIDLRPLLRFTPLGRSLLRERRGPGAGQRRPEGTRNKQKPALKQRQSRETKARATSEPGRRANPGPVEQPHVSIWSVPPSPPVDPAQLATARHSGTCWKCGHSLYGDTGACTNQECMTNDSTID